MAVKRKLVTLVATEVFTPYKQNEVFSVDEELAEKLLHVDRTVDTYGRQRYPKVKCRPFNPMLDGDTLLNNHSLPLVQHNALLKKLHPDWPTEQEQTSEIESDVTQLLDEVRAESEVAEADVAAKRGEIKAPPVEPTK